MASCFSVFLWFYNLIILISGVHIDWAAKEHGCIGHGVPIPHPYHFQMTKLSKDIWDIISQAHQVRYIGKENEVRREPTTAVLPREPERERLIANLLALVHTLLIFRFCPYILACIFLQAVIDPPQVLIAT